MARKKLSRNAPCPCGSGKKYKHCCYGKGFEWQGDDGEGRHTDQVQYPLGTVAFYGPNDRTTTKIAAAMFQDTEAEPVLKRWVGTDVTTSPKVQRSFRSSSSITASSRRR